MATATRQTDDAPTGPVWPFFIVAIALGNICGAATVLFPAVLP